VHVEVSLSPAVAGPAFESLPHGFVFRRVGVSLEVRSDDEAFEREFVSVFGAVEKDGEGLSDVSARLVAASSVSGFGALRLTGDDLADPAGFLLGFSSPDIPLEVAPPAFPGWATLRLETQAGALFAFRGDVCLFSHVPRWRRVLSHYLFLRLLRLRSDAIFFHAASLGIGGKGVLVVGPKGTGKSTLALALAARGHLFLGDETACYLPQAGQLLPFDRPVGVKPGPRAVAVGRALAALGPRADEDGLIRVPVRALLPGVEAAPVPLAAVVFLAGFEPKAALAQIEPGREELAHLQPMASSLVGAPATRRVFEMVRLLSTARSYRLVCGAPDETAALVEEVLGKS
jgi:hypothetical protein